MARGCSLSWDRCYRCCHSGQRWAPVITLLLCTLILSKHWSDWWPFIGGVLAALRVHPVVQRVFSTSANLMVQTCSPYWEHCSRRWNGGRGWAPVITLLWCTLFLNNWSDWWPLISRELVALSRELVALGHGVHYWYRAPKTYAFYHDDEHYWNGGRGWAPVITLLWYMLILSNHGLPCPGALGLPAIARAPPSTGPARDDNLRPWSEWPLFGPSIITAPAYPCVSVGSTGSANHPWLVINGNSDEKYWACEVYLGHGTISSWNCPRFRSPVSVVPLDNRPLVSSCWYTTTKSAVLAIRGSVLAQHQDPAAIKNRPRPTYRLHLRRFASVCPDLHPRKPCRPARKRKHPAADASTATPAPAASMPHTSGGINDTP